MQDVPVAVSAISGDSAEKLGVTSSEAIALVTPSMDFSRQRAYGATPFLRGVGSPQTTTRVEAPVALYIDDVDIAGPKANIFPFNNTEGIQVLKWPQGALFGRSATGGVIQIKTKRPRCDGECEASLGYGHHDYLEGRADSAQPADRDGVQGSIWATDFHRCRRALPEARQFACRAALLL